MAKFFFDFFVKNDIIIVIISILLFDIGFLGFR